MPRVGFEPTISADDRGQTYALDRAATGTGFDGLKYKKLYIYIYIHTHTHIYIYLCFLIKRSTSVCIAPAYGLDGPGTQSQWGRVFLHLSRQALRPTQRPVQWVPCRSRG